MLLRLFGFIILVSLSAFIHAQEIEEDIVYLENGEIYRGTIMEPGDTSVIRLKTRAANELIFESENIKKIKSEQVSQEVYQNQEIEKDMYTQKGYALGIDFGFLPGQSRYNEFKLGFSTGLINSYVFNPHFSAGISVASHLYSDLPVYQYLPIYVNATGHLLEANLTPYATASFGWTAPWLNKTSDYNNVKDFEGGRAYRFGIGIKRFFEPEVAYFFEIGVTSDRLNVVKESRGDFTAQQETYTKNRIQVKFGFQF